MIDNEKKRENAEYREHRKYVEFLKKDFVNNPKPNFKKLETFMRNNQYVGWTGKLGNYPSLAMNYHCIQVVEYFINRKYEDLIVNIKYMEEQIESKLEINFQFREQFRDFYCFLNEMIVTASTSHNFNIDTVKYLFEIKQKKVSEMIKWANEREYDTLKNDTDHLKYIDEKSFTLAIRNIYKDFKTELRRNTDYDSQEDADMFYPIAYKKLMPLYIEMAKFLIESGGEIDEWTNKEDELFVNILKTHKESFLMGNDAKPLNLRTSVKEGFKV